MSDGNQVVESYKFRDIVVLWGRERLVHAVIMARELATGIIREGLRFQSVSPQWVKSSLEFRGYPYVGYAARAGDRPAVIRAEALEHLLQATRGAVDPDPCLLDEEFVSRADFHDWLIHTGRALPAFWFDIDERYAEKRE
jgi:hypothetical protein